jgi:hypothetical protein
LFFDASDNRIKKRMFCNWELLETRFRVQGSRLKVQGKEHRHQHIIAARYRGDGL